MPATLDIKQLSTPEKIRLIEALWHELSDSEVASPSWHGDVLAERDQLIASGKDSFLDWEVAKEQLRQELR